MAFVSAGIGRAVIWLRQCATRLEGWWFDVSRGADTSGYIQLSSLTLMGEAKSGFEYFPTRPSRARAVLRDLPLRNYSAYTFVDLGSGKGRMLLIAAEFPFSRISGVEFARELHQSAVANVGRARRRGWRCSRIEPVNIDAADYRFPDGNLVLYLFNPFGADVLSKILSNLHSSLRENPRHVAVIITHSEFTPLADSTTWLSLCRQTPHYRIYEACRPVSPG